MDTRHGCDTKGIRQSRSSRIIDDKGTLVNEQKNMPLCEYEMLF